MGIVNIDDILYDQLCCVCIVFSCLINVQVNFWIWVGMLCEMNFMLSFQDIVVSELCVVGVQLQVLVFGWV